MSRLAIVAIMLSCSWAMKPGDEQARLLLAVEACDREAVESMLPTVSDITWTDETGASLVHHAARRGCSQILQLLIDAGAIIDSRDPLPGWTPLVTCIEVSQDLPCVVTLLNAGADVNTHDDNGATALHYAATRHDSKLVGLLLESGAALNARDSSGQLPLHWALRAGDDEAAQRFLSAGASPGAAVEGGALAGKLPLHLAAEYCDTSTVSAVLDAGAVVDGRDAVGNTALMLAAHRGSLSTVHILLQAGSSVQTANERGETALLLATAARQLAITMLLIGAGADVETADVEGMSPLMVAAGQLDPAIVRCLLDCGARVDTATIRGRSALGVVIVALNEPQAHKQLQDLRRTSKNTPASGESAILQLMIRNLEKRHADRRAACLLVIDLLIDRGADPNWRDNTGRTVLMLGATYGDAGTIERLLALAAGAARSARCSHGKSAFQYAAERTDAAADEILRLLGER